MKKVANLVTDFEGKFESAPQLFLQLTILFAGDDFMETTAVDLYGMLSSLLMLSKDLAENILLNTQRVNFYKLLFLEKLFAMMRIVPCIILTVIFRIGTVALTIHHIFAVQYFYLLVPLQLTMILPFFCLTYFKSYSSNSFK